MPAAPISTIADLKTLGALAFQAIAGANGSIDALDVLTVSSKTAQVSNVSWTPATGSITVDFSQPFDPPDEVFFAVCFVYVQPSGQTVAALLPASMTGRQVVLSNGGPLAVPPPYKFAFFAIAT